MEWQESFSINIHCNSEPDLNDPQWMASQVVQGPVSRERRRKPRRMVVGWWFEVLPKTLKLEGTRKRSLDFFRGSDDFIPPAFPGASRRRRGIGVESKRLTSSDIPSSPLSWRQTVAWHQCPIGIHNLVMKGDELDIKTSKFSAL